MALPNFSISELGPKLLVPLVAVGVGAVGFVFYSGKAQEAHRIQAELVQAQGREADLKGEKERLEQQLSDFQAQRNNLEKQLSAVRGQLASQSTEIEKARESLLAGQSQISQVTQERDQLQLQLASVTAEREDTKTRLGRVEQEKGELQRSIARLRERMTLLDRDYRQLADKLSEAENRPNSSLTVVSSSGPSTNGGSSAQASAAESAPPSTIAGAVELPPIIVRKDQAGISASVRGRVLEVSESHNFLVLDKGSMDGVRVGMTLDILRGSESVGHATVVRVRPQLSACDLVHGATSGLPQVGDTVVQSGQ